MVRIYHKQTGEGSERHVVDAKEILADPNTEYSLNPPGGKASGVTGGLIIGGISPDGLGSLQKHYRSTAEIIARTWTEIQIEVGLENMTAQDWATLQQWYQVAWEAARTNQHLVNVENASLGLPVINVGEPEKRGPGRPPSVNRPEVTAEKVEVKS